MTQISPRAPQKVWEIKTKSAVLDFKQSCRGNHLLEMEASLNLTERRKHLTKESHNKCDFYLSHEIGASTSNFSPLYF